MELKLLGYKTDLIFTKLDGQILDRGDYLVVKTLSNPNYYWGNLLIFSHPPKTGDLEEWKKKFLSEFPDPSIYHMTFTELIVDVYKTLTPKKPSVFIKNEDVINVRVVSDSFPFKG